MSRCRSDSSVYAFRCVFFFKSHSASQLGFVSWGRVCLDGEECLGVTPVGLQGVGDGFER